MIYKVNFTKENNLCISCGICEAVCPKGCISFVKEQGNYFPQIGEKCVDCGLCFNVCPGKGRTREEYLEIKEYDLIGQYARIYNAWSKDASIRHHSASGGVATTIVHKLLTENLYDVAFVINDFNFEHQVYTKGVYNGDILVNFDNDLHITSKSRYVPVNHSNTVNYIILNPNKKVIIVGTPCALRGILNVIKLKGLKRDNYLLLGLFCESVMNYRIWDYFNQKKFTKGKTLSALHFKNKESGGWPGNIKMIFSDGSFCYYDKSYRMEVKTHFKPERCLYCIDKLNVNADISLGDNYTGIDDSPLGSNTVIIRTEYGEAAWENYIDNIEYRDIEVDQIIKAQGLKDRAKNIDFAFLKEQEIKKQTGVGLDINGFGKQGVQPDMSSYNMQMKKIGGGVRSLSLITA